MSGWTSQQTGDLGASVVQTALERADFTVGRLTPDPGEDLWAEVDGRRSVAQGDFPFRALVQVKASREELSEFVVDIDVDQIRRWAAQPLPVFLVGVSIPCERLFAKSVDEIVSEDLGGRDPFQIQTKTTRVRLRPEKDVGLSVKTAVYQHYASSKLALADVTDADITSHYFEILVRRHPTAGVSIPTAVWTILWKSSPRPQHCASMVSELIRRARSEYEHFEPRPMLFFFNIFRSVEDRHYNVASARVEVVNPEHPKADELRTHLEIPRGYNVRPDRGVTESREYWQSITMPPEEFRDYAKQVGAVLDMLTLGVLERVRGDNPVWDTALDSMFHAIQVVWENPTIAPAECRMLERVLDEQFNCLLQHRLVSRNARKQYEAEQLNELGVKLAQCLGSWAVVLRNEW